MYIPEYIYDVIIIGAGVAGCSTAISLKNNNPSLNIAIVERGTHPIFRKDKYRIGETLPPHSNQILQQLGLFKSFKSLGFLTAYGTSSSWGQPELYHNEFIYSVNGYGWQINRSKFDGFLIDEAIKKDIKVYFNSHTHEYVFKQNIWSIHSNKTIYESNFLVDATGKQAAVSTTLQAKKIKSDTLVGLYKYYSNISTDSIKGTYIESDTNGWWYSTTLPNNTLVVAYMTDSDIAKSKKLNKPNIFNALLDKSNYTKHRIHTTCNEKPKIISAHTQQLDTSIGKAWLAVGDASISYDPLSSLGIFKAMSSGRYASYAILDFLNHNPKGLEKYQFIINKENQAYYKKKHEYYMKEQRFSNQLFWKRRHQLKIN